MIINKPKFTDGEAFKILCVFKLAVLQSFAPGDLTLETEWSSTNYIPGEVETYHAVSTNF